VRRRTFLLFTTGFAVMGPTAARDLPGVALLPDAALGIDDHHWRVIDRTMDHLFPDERNAPGAGAAHATAWLHNGLRMPEVDDAHRRFIGEGAIDLERLSREQEKKSFLELTTARREAVLRQLELRPGGKAWLQELLRYILEALLSDPVYGGNPGGTGWAWLEHRPGFPRPPKEKRYFLL